MTPTARPAATLPDTTELDAAIEAAEQSAVVVWRGERIAFPDVPDRVARIDDRAERDRMYGAYLDALEALAPRHLERVERWSQADVVEVVAARGVDPRELAADLERFVLHGETPYYAALRRYLALVDIEQGDATEADVWHIARGSARAHWFVPRRAWRAVEATGRPASGDGTEGWMAVERMLAGIPDDATPGIPAEAVSQAYASLLGSSDWLEQELGMAATEVVPFVDFATFVRLWRVRRAIARLQYELRIFTAFDPDVARAYYSGILSHMTGVLVPEQGFLYELRRPFGSMREIQVALLAGDLVEVLERRHGPTWWRERDAAGLAREVAGAERVDDALARLGYDALDWRPVLRQIRTRLIGEMSGYGGPNITTRAGTRKV